MSCQPPTNVVLSRAGPQGHFLITWTHGDPNRIAYNVALRVFNPNFYTKFEVIEGRRVSKHLTALIFKRSTTLPGDTYKAEVSTTCKDCTESEPAFSNELGPY